MEFLRQLCAICGPSGDEGEISRFICDHVKKNQHLWKKRPIIFKGDDFQDALVLVFGQPRTAIFAHMDTVGFTVGYGKNLIDIGSPKWEGGEKLMGQDKDGPFCAELIKKGKRICNYRSDRTLELGTSLTFKPDFKLTKKFVQSNSLDNRLGMWSALKVAESLEDGVIAFTCWEEHVGGSAQNLARFAFEKYGVKQALISDITWITKGVRPGKGVAISLRDSSVPRRSFVDKIRAIAEESGISHQLEVEEFGGSDGRALQLSPYPFDWCFVGAGSKDPHSPKERVHRDDIDTMVELYKVLMKKL